MGDLLLVVNADPFEREIMEKIFSDKFGIQFTSSTGLSRRLSRHPRPSVILFELPIADPAILRSMCELRWRHAPTTPFIVVVSENSIELERFARQQGTFYYLLRPFEMRELSHVLEAAFAHAMRGAPERFPSARS